MLGFILLMTIGVQAQDKIYQAGGKIILAKIQEIGVDEVKYKLFEDLEGPTYGIEKDRVVKIIFQNGRTETYRSGLRDPELYAGQQKDALKLNFMSPLFGHTQLFYERSLKPGRSIEFSLDLVGAGKNYTIDYVYYDPNNPNPQEVKRGAAGALYQTQSPDGALRGKYPRCKDRYTDRRASHGFLFRTHG